MRKRRVANLTETSLYHCNSHRNRIPQYEIFTRTFFSEVAHIQQCNVVISACREHSYSQLHTNFRTVVAHTISYLCESVDVVHTF